MLGLSIFVLIATFAFIGLYHYLINKPFTKKIITAKSLSKSELYYYDSVLLSALSQEILDNKLPLKSVEDLQDNLWTNVESYMKRLDEISNGKGKLVTYDKSLLKEVSTIIDSAACLYIKAKEEQKKNEDK